jgi:hypothetical protein
VAHDHDPFVHLFDHGRGAVLLLLEAIDATPEAAGRIGSLILFTTREAAEAEGDGSHENHQQGDPRYFKHLEPSLVGVGFLRV